MNFFGVNDTLGQILSTREFLEGQGHKDSKNVANQDNKKVQYCLQRNVGDLPANELGTWTSDTSV